MMEVLTEGAEPPVLEAITEKVVVADGAATFTVQAVDEMPLLQLQDVGVLPPLQIAARVTVVPAKTGEAVVLGDCEMLQLLGAVTLLLPIYTVVPKVAPEP